MKNLFLIKNLCNLFSFGKDSVFFFFKCFYKKKKNIFINYNLIYFKKYFLQFFNPEINIFKKFTFNELIFRKIKISIVKNTFVYMHIMNHHLLDKIETIFNKLIKKKKQIVIINNWYFKNKYVMKPLINIFLKNYKLNIKDSSNKYIFIERNFLRCLISKFIK
ncbi:hypothetical protein CRP_024 [Candidatus Carsonella ruddii PV]|uniref:Uncharacterized protein n=1 Tax=Carsonella ruddii (strain PV) TaxID=387662 RepID=Q05FW6_CARRP|nr:hypothetical protein [Candidatus Carsonella ruddii]BAF35055.1 hypothetical protein CRP_024 [Candidatus Carsonella ruddii PV]